MGGKLGDAYIPVHGDFSPIRRQMAAEARTLGKGIKLDTNQIDRDLAKVRTELAEIAKAKAEAKADLDTSAFDRRAKILRAEVARLNALKATVKVEGSRDVDLLKKKIDSAVPSIGSGTAALTLFGGGGLAAAKGAIAAAGGIVSLVSALAPLSGASVGVPALFGALAQGGGTGALAVYGLNDALKALTTQQADAGSTAIDMGAQTEAAARQVESAERAVADAKRAAKYAEEDLTAAREAAREEIAAQRHDLVSLTDAEKDSALGVREAERALKDARRARGTDEAPSLLELRGLEQAVVEAKHAHADATREAKSAEEELNKAEREGIDKSPQVVDALRARADARRGVKQSIEAVAAAEKDATAAATGMSDSAETLQQKIDALPESTQRFARYLFALKPELDNLRETAAAGLFPGVEKGIEGALKLLPELDDAVDSTSHHLGDAATEFGQFLGRDGFGEDFGVIVKENNGLIDNAAGVTMNLTDALRNVLVVGAPFIDWMGDGIEHFSAFIEKETEVGRKTGDMADFFDDSQHAIEDVVDIGGSLVNILGDIGHASKPFGDDYLQNLREGANQLERWTGSIEGQRSLRSYFAESEETLDELAAAIKDILDEDSLSDSVGRAIQIAVPVVAQNAGQLGLAILQGMVTGFVDEAVHGDALAALFTAGAFIRLVGGKGALRKIGVAIAAEIGAPMATTIAAETAAGGVLGDYGVIGGKPSVLGTKFGMAAGVAIGVAAEQAAEPYIQDLFHIEDNDQLFGDHTSLLDRVGEFTDLWGDKADFKNLAEGLDIFGEASADAADQFAGDSKQTRQNLKELSEAFRDDGKLMQHSLGFVGDDFGALKARAANSLNDVARDLGDTRGDALRDLGKIIGGLQDTSESTKRETDSAGDSLATFSKRGKIELGKAADSADTFDRRSSRSFGGVGDSADDLQHGVSVSMDDLKGAIGDAYGWIEGRTNNAMKALGVVGKGADFVTGTPAGGGKDGKGKNARGGLNNFAGGGITRVPGLGLEDTVPLRSDMIVAPGEDLAVFNRHQRPLVDAAVAEKYGVSGLPGFFGKFNRPHNYAKGGLPEPDFGGHPSNVNPNVAQLIALMQQQFPGLAVSSTTDHAAMTASGNPSDHASGDAVDMSNADYGYMDKAAAWINSSGVYKSLKQGIHNPNLSVNDGQQVDPSFYSSVWADHRDHLHLAIISALSKQYGPAAAKEIARVLIHGPDGAVKTLAQTGADNVRGAANDLISSLGSGPTAGGPAGGPVDLKNLPPSLQKYNKTYPNPTTVSSPGASIPMPDTISLNRAVGFGDGKTRRSPEEMAAIQSRESGGGGPPHPGIIGDDAGIGVGEFPGGNRVDTRPGVSWGRGDGQETWEVLSSSAVSAMQKFGNWANPIANKQMQYWHDTHSASDPWYLSAARGGLIPGFAGGGLPKGLKDLLDKPPATVFGYPNGFKGQPDPGHIIEQAQRKLKKVFKFQDELKAEMSAIAKLDEEIDRYDRLAQLDGEFTETERKHELGQNYQLYYVLQEAAGTSKKGSRFVKEALPYARGKQKDLLKGISSTFSDTLVDLTGLTGKSGRVFDTYLTLAELGQPQETDPSTLSPALSVAGLREFAEAVRYGIFDQLPKAHDGAFFNAPASAETPMMIRGQEAVVPLDGAAPRGTFVAEIPIVIELPGETVRQTVRAELKLKDAQELSLHRAGVA